MRQEYKKASRVKERPPVYQNYNYAKPIYANNNPLMYVKHGSSSREIIQAPPVKQQTVEVYNPLLRVAQQVNPIVRVGSDRNVNVVKVVPQNVTHAHTYTQGPPMPGQPPRQNI